MIKKFNIQDYQNIEGIKVEDGKVIAARDGYFDIIWSLDGKTRLTTIYVQKGEEIPLKNID